MKKFNIKNLFDYATSKNAGIFGNTENFDFMEQYNSNKLLVSRFFKDLYASKNLKEEFDTAKDELVNLLESVLKKGTTFYFKIKI